MMTTETRQELARMAAELDAWGFEPGGPVNDPDDPHYVYRAAGAPVYGDILSMGGTGTRAQVQACLDKVLLHVAQHPAWKPTVQAAAEVANHRLRGSWRVSSPLLPPDAGAYYVPRTVAPRPIPVPCGQAGELGAKAAKALRLHARTPFGPRGETWIVNVARAAWRAALAAE